MHTAHIESMPWTERTADVSTLHVDTQYLDPRGKLVPAVNAELGGAGGAAARQQQAQRYARG